MMKQYFEIKEQYKDTILFFRLGDFYEMFFDDAILVSKELELTLTGREDVYKRQGQGIRKSLRPSIGAPSPCGRRRPIAWTGTGKKCTPNTRRTRSVCPRGRPSAMTRRRTP